MAVKALEDAYGVELFRRRGRRVERTELGDALLDVTTRLFGMEEAAEELLGGARGLRSGRLRVGADAPYHVMALLAAFHDRHPGVGISLTVGNAEEVLRDLRGHDTVLDLLHAYSKQLDASLEPTADGTRIEQRYDIVKGAGPLEALYATILPQHRDREAALVADLRRLGEVARRGHAEPANGRSSEAVG